MHEGAPGLRISLPPQVNAPSQARRHLQAMLRGRLPELLEQRALLLISELATIAVLHRRRSAITVWLSVDVPRMRAEMREIAPEATPRRPPIGVIPHLDEADEAVHLALRLVDCFASSWGDLESNGHWFEVTE
jgi:hypothetical protein